MGPDPQEHNFNWIEALSKCSVLCEFSKLSGAVRENIEECTDANIVFREISPDRFATCRKADPCASSEDYDQCVYFTREPEKIQIEISDRSGIQCRHEVTLTLNNDGECRYRINGEGEFLRWQVLRTVLEDFLFFKHEKPPAAGISSW